MASSSGGGRGRRLAPVGGGDSSSASAGGDLVDFSEVAPWWLAEIAPILHVANEVEASSPRVAYLCRFYAFERENDPTLKGRVQQSDAREIHRFYKLYYKKYIQALQNAAAIADRAQLTRAYQTAAVLFEVLNAVNVSQEIEVDQSILETHNQVEEKKKLYVDPDSANQAIMTYPEVATYFLSTFYHS